MIFTPQFAFERDSSGRHGISLVAIDPASGEAMGPARIHDYVFGTVDQAIAKLIGTLRAALKNAWPGISPSHFLFPAAAGGQPQKDTTTMQIGLRFLIEKQTNGKYSIAVAATAPDGGAIGQPAVIHDAAFNSAEEAADRLVGALRGAFKNYAPPAFGRDFLFPSPELARHL